MGNRGAERSCRGCGLCRKACPTEAIAGDRRMVHVIDQTKCIKCGTCAEACPPRFSAVVEVSGDKVAVPDEPNPVGSWA